MTCRFCVTILPALFLLVGPGSSQSQVTEPNLERFLKDSRSQVEHQHVLGAEIEKLFRDDQAQGSPEFLSGEKLRAWEVDHEKRILRMREIARTESLQTIPDLYNAGLLLQHGIAPEDFLTAHVLFTAAALKRVDICEMGGCRFSGPVSWMDRPPFPLPYRPGATQPS